MPNTFAYLLLAFAAVALLPHFAHAQGLPPGSYGYVSYTVLDRTAPGPDSLTTVPNVSGSLWLGSDGTYQKISNQWFPE